jgi:hypothetical protein
MTDSRSLAGSRIPEQVILTLAVVHPRPSCASRSRTDPRPPSVDVQPADFQSIVGLRRRDPNGIVAKHRSSCRGHPLVAEDERSKVDLGLPSLHRSIDNDTKNRLKLARLIPTQRIAATLDQGRLVLATSNGALLLDRVDCPCNFLLSVDASFTSVAWSPLGDRIATGANGGTVQIWDATSLKRAAPPGRVNSIGVGGVAFSPDGSLVASTSAFAVTQLWLTDTGAPFGGPLVGGDPPIAVESLPSPERPSIPFVPSFAPDGSAVYVGSDHPMRCSLASATWTSAACTIAGRELTATEWACFLPTLPRRPTCRV